MSGRRDRWRSDPGQDQGPVRLGAVIRDALAATGASQEAVVWTAVFAHWEVIVGTRNAGHVRPYAVRDGRLVVVVDHPARATQVRAMQSVMRERIAQVSGWEPEALEVVVQVPGSRGSGSSGGFGS